jgi:hypothetical protein
MYLFTCKRLQIGITFSMDGEVVVFFKAKIIQYMPCATRFFNHDIPCIKWHPLTGVQHFIERNTVLFSKRLAAVHGSELSFRFFQFGYFNHG